MRPTRTTRQPLSSGHPPFGGHLSSYLSNKILFPNGAVLFSKLNPRNLRFWHVHDDHPYRRVCLTEFLPLVPDASSLKAEFLAYTL